MIYAQVLSLFALRRLSGQIGAPVESWAAGVGGP